MWKYYKFKPSANRKPDNINKVKEFVTSLRSWRCVACKTSLFDCIKLLLDIIQTGVLSKQF